jgi:hypothetical protein
MTHRQLTIEQRYLIYKLRKEQYSQKRIAELISFPSPPTPDNSGAAGSSGVGHRCLQEMVNDKFRCHLSGFRREYIRE